jgi:hypothetical protein
VRALPPHAREVHPFVADPAGVWLYLVGALAPDAAAPRNTDAWPWLELHAPAGHAARAADLGLPALEPTAARPLEGTPLAAVGPDPLRWRDTAPPWRRPAARPAPRARRACWRCCARCPSRCKEPWASIAENACHAPGAALLSKRGRWRSS